jgi:REP element-mobilizing transposase RayT
MPFWRSYAHLVWATYDRQPYLQPELEQAIYAYIVKKASELDTYIHAINGWVEHMHIVASIPPKHSVAWVVKEWKGASAHYVNHTLRPAAFHFGWQRGYGYLTLGEGQCPRAVEYVLKQKEHHQQQTTNTWLEKYAEEDEGPPDPGPPPTLIHRHLLREERVLYSVESPFPF